MEFMEKIKSFRKAPSQVLQIVPSEETPAEEDDFFKDLCPALTFQQRLIGFASCFTIGYLMTFCSFKFFIKLMEGNPLPFVVNFTIGNILALMASVFLCGPKRQLKNMMDDKRKFSALLYVSCLVGTMIFVFLPLEHLLKLSVLVLLLLVQLSALVWYNLSYIPFGRRTFCRCFKKTVGLDESESQAIV
mmetsp:Transcript_27126/g.39725  ORF Transcript_27126/g.39725 Transcript_27126/m.39725 type:complete len:189 (-) Transcript_27126:230-796(-)|eukprot:CAMPEP_0194028642 /NCGR_PEP_ID=MMETSP0009_2-20130614/2561_1 /TAXON_ID=210454 /ORGANISM="Grammatophora oceanica, Strain CCMP 410" /LENGTH=188 /DNA_ID=CAMNT_0038668087 /DNA_START=84 /DNA_END=650 /DNA_ORIENTATION=-